MSVGIIKIAVIGAGVNSLRNHLPVLKRLSSEGYCRLVVVCDLNLEAAKRASSLFGFEEHTHDVSNVFSRSNIDAVYVFGTVEMHYEYMMQGLKKGMHVFVEKPPAPNLEKTLEAMRLSIRMGKVTGVGFNRRFYQSMNHARNITDGRTHIYSIEGVYNKPFLNETYMHGSSSWISYSAIHGIDGVCHLMGAEGRPVSVYSAVNKASGDVPQNLSTILVWPSGSHAVLSSNNSAGLRMEKYTIHTRGASYSCTESEFSSVMQDGREETVKFKDPHEFRGFYGEHREFLEAIHDGKPARHSLENSLTVMHLVELMEKGYCGEIDWSDLSVEKIEQNNDVSGEIETIRVKNDVSGSILVLNPNALGQSLSRISAGHKIIYKDDLAGMSSEQRERVQAVITGPGGGALDKETLDLIPNTKVVGIVGASIKKYNPEAILSKSIPIINAADIYADAVAEFTLMQALLGLKNASRSHDVMRSGGWGIVMPNFTQETMVKIKKLLNSSAVGALRPLFQAIWKSAKPVIPVAYHPGAGLMKTAGKNLTSKKVGLVGYGAIAREFIRLLEPFECDIWVYSEYLSDDEAASLDVKKGNLSEVLDSDIVSLHRGLSDRTRGSFGKEEISLLKSGAIFLNTARGAIVDEAALIERLKKGDIFACLDVFEHEPLPKNSPLRKLPNVFLTSHIGGVTKETFAKSPSAVVEKVLAYLAGEKIPHVITSREFLDNMS